MKSIGLKTGNLSGCTYGIVRIKQSVKRHFVDLSLACALLGVTTNSSYNCIEELEDEYPVNLTEFTKNFRYQITRMLEQLQKKKYKVLLLLDETKKLDSHMRTFISTYQHLLRERYDISLVMAGLPKTVTDILNDDILSFLRRAKQVSLENVPFSAVLQEYAEVIGAEYRIKDETIHQAAVTTKGYPYLIQLMGYYLWEFLRRGEEEKEALQMACDESRAMMFQNVHTLLYRELSVGDKAFVKAMAVDDGTSKFSAIIKRTGKSKNHASTYRVRLIDSGYVRAMGYGELAFSIPFTKEFIEQEMYY